MGRYIFPQKQIFATKDATHSESESEIIRHFFQTSTDTYNLTFVLVHLYDYFREQQIAVR